MHLKNKLNILIQKSYDTKNKDKVYLAELGPSWTVPSQTWAIMVLCHPQFGLSWPADTLLVDCLFLICFFLSTFPSPSHLFYGLLHSFWQIVFYDVFFPFFLWLHLSPSSSSISENLYLFFHLHLFSCVWKCQDQTALCWIITTNLWQRLFCLFFKLHWC